MSKIKNGGLDQYGAGPLKQQQFGTAGVEGVRLEFKMCCCAKLRNSNFRKSKKIFECTVRLSNIVSDK